MKTFLKKFAAVGLAALLALGVLPTLVGAQSFGGPVNPFKTVEAAGGGFGAISTDTAILIRYVGPGVATAPTVAVASGSITLKTNGAADTSTECPVSGPLGGIIDLTNAACDTLGEVVDAINAPGSNWRAVILDGLRSDTSNGMFTTFADSATDVSSVNGRAIFWLTTAFHAQTFSVTSQRGLGAYVDAKTGNLNLDPFKNNRPQLLGVTAQYTGTGASTLNIYSVRDTYNPTTRAGTQVVTTLYSSPGAATTVQFTPTLSSYGILGNWGEHIIVRYQAATTYTAGNISAYGLNYKQ